MTFPFVPCYDLINWAVTAPARYSWQESYTRLVITRDSPYTQGTRKKNLPPPLELSGSQSKDRLTIDNSCRRDRSYSYALNFYNSQERNCVFVLQRILKIIIINTLCPRISDPFYVVTYYINVVTTSWTYNTNKTIQFCRYF